MGPLLEYRNTLQSDAIGLSAQQLMYGEANKTLIPTTENPKQSVPKRNLITQCKTLQKRYYDKHMKPL